MTLAGIIGIICSLLLQVIVGVVIGWAIAAYVCRKQKRK